MTTDLLVSACSIAIAVGMILAALWCGRAEEPAELAGGDDSPTAPIPTVPAVPVPPAAETHLTMLRRDELLWFKSDPDDPEGVITLGLVPEVDGQLGVLVDDNGIALGLRLDRGEVQSLRHALTSHLVATSKPVRP